MDDDDAHTDAEVGRERVEGRKGESERGREREELHDPFGKCDCEQQCLPQEHLHRFSRTSLHLPWIVGDTTRHFPPPLLNTSAPITTHVGMA